VVIDKQSQKVICLTCSNGKRHDFRVFKESKVRLHSKIKVITDTGYQGLQKLYTNTQMPKKKTKKKPLTPQEKAQNKQLSRQRVINENVIGVLKRFKIIADRYRNRRKRFHLRFNLIAGIYNWQLS
jgi:hypothetical protein